MNRSTVPVLVLLILAFASASPILLTAEADSSAVVRQRAQGHLFEWSGNASNVSVHGEWDGWVAGTPLVEIALDQWALEMPLAPGMHCYKFVIDDVWSLDDGNPYTGYCGVTENSVARVANVTHPMYSATVENDLLTVLWHAGTSGAGPSGTPTALTGAAWNATAWTWTLDLAGFADGKHTLHLEGMADDGVVAEDLLLPFWRGQGADFVWDDALIYMLMTDRFVNGNTSNDPSPLPNAAQGADWMGGDFTGVTAHIEAGTFTDLGVNALWLTPFNTAANGTGLAADGVHEVSAYHGYWPVEPRGVDPRLGTPEELEALVDAAHAAGIRVLGDFVVNHVHEDHPYHDEHPEWFNSGCICGEANCDWTEHRLECLFRGYMPDVNWKQRNASEAMIEDVLWWMETFDLDGGRIDAVKHVDDLAITNLAVRINERFETVGTDMYLKGETAMGWAGHDLAANANEYGTINRYIGEHQLDGQADFVLYHATSDRVFTGGEEDYMHLDYWTERSQDQYVDGAVMVPFVGSHDVSRFASRADPGTADEWNQWAEQGLPGQPGTDAPYAASLQAHAWLLTIPGAPMIYMGDEYGEYGGADPDNRHVWRNATERNDREQHLHENISTIGQIRAESEALRRGGYASVHSTPDVLVYQRATADASSLVGLNRGATDSTVTLAAAHADHVVVFGAGTFDAVNLTLEVPAGSVIILSNESVFASNESGNETQPADVLGCTDAAADNHNPAATADDGSCTYPPVDVPGCTDDAAENHDGAATVDDGSCTYPPVDVPGCMDANATNYDANATVDNGSCNFPPVEVPGCMDMNATNYDANATVDNGSCSFPPVEVPGCMDMNATNYNANATVSDESCAFPDPDVTAPDGNQTEVEDDGTTAEPVEQNEGDSTPMADLLGSIGTYGGALILGLVLMGLSWAIRRTAS